MADTCVIFNPTAKGDKARRFRAEIERIAPEAVLMPTNAPGDAQRLAREAVEKGFNTIAGAGGDGTLNEVANGIIDAPGSLQKARFAALPLGTVNVFALELKIPFSTEKAWGLLSAGKEQTIDVLEAEFQLKGKTERRVCLQLAGAGWDAHAVEAVSWELKKRLGRFAYVVAGLRALRAARAPVRVRAGGEAASGDFVMIGNGRFYGGPFPFMHRAELADGLMDATVFEKFNWRSLPGFGANFVLGRYFRPGAQKYLQAAEIELTSGGPAPLQLDGELVGHLPAKIQVLPRALRVVVP